MDILDSSHRDLQDRNALAADQRTALAGDHHYELGPQVTGQRNLVDISRSFSGIGSGFPGRGDMTFFERKWYSLHSAD